MLKSFSLKNRQDAVKFKMTIKVESLRLSAHMPWHSEKVWYHSSARQCATVGEEIRFMCINIKRGSSNLFTKLAQVSDSVLEQVFPLRKTIDDFTARPSFPDSSGACADWVG
jgi:hypothetical protein